MSANNTTPPAPHTDTRHAAGSRPALTARSVQEMLLEVALRLHATRAVRLKRAGRKPAAAGAGA